MRQLAAAALVLALAGCSEGDEQARFRPGTYAGSTGKKQAVTVEVGAGTVRLDGRELRRGPRGSFVDPDRDVRLRCEPGAGTGPDDEIVCEITRGGVTERVELMRL